MQGNVPFSSSNTSMAALHDQLSGIALLDNLSGDELNLLLPFLQFMQAAAGTAIVEQGSSDRLWGIVLDGHISVSIASDTATHQTLVRGMSFGQGTLVDDLPHSAAVIADTDCQLALLSRDSFRKLSASHPIIGVRLLHKICRALCQQLRQPGGPVMECLG